VAIEIRLLTAADETILADVAPEVFDNPVQPRLAASSWPIRGTILS
jgi:hypothetical protein